LFRKHLRRGPDEGRALIQVYLHYSVLTVSILEFLRIVSLLWIEFPCIMLRQSGGVFHTMNTVLHNFIVFEGLDGAGTTTQMKLLAETCDRQERSCHATFEPTSNPIGRLVRSVLQKQVVTTPLALAMLYAADREDHLNNPVTGIVGKLEAGQLVISDRYLYSSLAYQSVECGFERIQQLNQFPAPRFIFYIDTPVEECMRRIESRGSELELFERRDFLLTVRSNYERIFSELPGGVRFVRLDGTLARETIARQVAEVLRNDGILD
jgi:dTMP kinase